MQYSRIHPDEIRETISQSLFYFLTVFWQQPRKPENLEETHTFLDFKTGSIIPKLVAINVLCPLNANAANQQKTYSQSEDNVTSKVRSQCRLKDRFIIFLIIIKKENAKGKATMHRTLKTKGVVINSNLIFFLLNLVIMVRKQSWLCKQGNTEIVL